MAVFRVHKNENYTVMSNHHFQNKEFSLKSMGLLSLMLSLSPTWDYSLKGFAVICQDGLNSVRSGMNELEKHGYVVRRRLRDEYGRLADTEYNIYEVPPNQKIKNP